MNNPSTSRPPVLRTENLGRSINGKILVADISLQLDAGEILAVVGPSGSGKSSLLRLLNRLDEPTHGTVYLQGVDYREIQAPTLRRKVGFVMQRPFLFPGTVADNLEYGPSQRGEVLPQEALSELLIKIGLRDYASRNVANLSGGEAQRVSVARTLANSPLILLLDEPTSALDDASKIEIETLLRRIVRDQQLACAIVTHDLSQAERLADRVLVLAAGRTVRSGPMREILHA